MQSGTLHLCIEEGTHAQWLTEILSPLVERMVTVRSPSRVAPRATSAMRSGAERLRSGRIETVVYKHTGVLATSRVRRMIVEESARDKT
jgi:hypothetical protein